MNAVLDIIAQRGVSGLLELTALACEELARQKRVTSGDRVGARWTENVAKDVAKAMERARQYAI
jgi:hypothetical protein